MDEVFDTTTRFGYLPSVEIGVKSVIGSKLKPGNNWA
jgi:hypothetical protein